MYKTNQEDKQAMGILMSILYFVVMLAIVFGLYVLGKEYVFNKVRINKYIPLAVAIVLLIVQMFGVIKISWIGIILTPIIVVSFLWFLDIHQTGGARKSEKKIVIKQIEQKKEKKTIDYFKKVVESIFFVLLNNDCVLL